MSDDFFTIAELASEFGVTARAIRFYEDQDLLKPTRQGQTRIYSAGDRNRLAWILRGKRVGFSLAEISEMLDSYHMDDDRNVQRRFTLEKCRERIATLTQQRADIDQMIEELGLFCSALERIIETPENIDEVRDEFRRSPLVNLPEGITIR